MYILPHLNWADYLKAVLWFTRLYALGMWVLFAYRAITCQGYASVQIVALILLPTMFVIQRLRMFDASNMDFQGHYQRMVPSMDCGLLRQGEPDIIGPGVRFKRFLLAKCVRYVGGCSFKFTFLGLSLFFPMTSHFSNRSEAMQLSQNYSSSWSGFFNQHAIKFRSIIALRYPFYVNF